MTDTYLYLMQVIDQRDKARAQLASAEDELGPLRRRVQELAAERDRLAAGVPLICSDERHEARVRGLAAQLAALHEGKEPYEDDCLMPNPGQWIWKWNRVTPAERAERAEQAIADADHQYECHMYAWPERARDAEAAVARIRAQCERWRYVSDRKRAAEDLLAELDRPTAAKAVP